MVAKAFRSSPGATGFAPNLLYRWRRLRLEGGSVAVNGDDEVTSNRQVREMDNRILELERQLGRKTLEVEILKEASERSGPRKATLLMHSSLPEIIR